MPLAPAGRHCAACQQTVVDFTLKTDAEILAFLARAAGGSACGRFAAEQLERPLQCAAPAAPTAARWRAWLAALVAVWAVREGVGAKAWAQAPVETRSRYWGGPVPATPAAVATGTAAPTPASAITGGLTMGLPIVHNFPDHLEPLAAAPRVLRGVVTDSISKEGLPGVTVLLTGTPIGVSTGTDGTFELVIPAQLASRSGASITVSSVGYVTQEQPLAAKAAGEPRRFRLQADMKGFMGVVVVAPGKVPPAPWHPRRLYYWGKYWLTRPFRRG